MATHVFPIDTLSARAWRLDALLLDRVRLRAWDRLLFIECGDGWLAEEASRRIGRGWVCGLSASNRLVDRATRLRGVQGRLEFKTWDAERLPVHDSSVDRVIWCVSWRLAPDPELALREVARVLEHDGDAYLIDPGVGSDGEPGAPFQDAALATVFGNAGLATVEQYHCDLPSSEWGDRPLPWIIHARLRTTEPIAH